MVLSKPKSECIPFDPQFPRMFSDEPTENDEAIFTKVASIHLTPEQIDSIVNPAITYRRQQTYWLHNSIRNTFRWN